MKKTEAHPARSLGFLSRLSDGEVPPAERAEFDLHRRVCPECAASADEFEAVLALYRSTEIPDVDPGLSARITRRIERELRHPESARFIPVKIDLVWASVVIVALAGAIATYSLVRPKTPRVVVLAEKKTPAQAPAPAFAPQAPPMANRPAEPEPERQARSRAPGRRASAGAAQPASGRADEETAAKAQPEEKTAENFAAKPEAAAGAPVPAPPAAMAAPEPGAGERSREARVLARDQAAAEEPIRLGPGVTPPVLVKRVEPSIDGSPRRVGLERVIVLEAVISARGDVQDVKILKSAPGFDGPVVQAVRQWKYKPAMKEGKPVAVYLSVTVNIVP